jgi:hypothetical protein
MTPKDIRRIESVANMGAGQEEVAQRHSFLGTLRRENLGEGFTENSYKETFWENP